MQKFWIKPPWLWCLQATFYIYFFHWRNSKQKLQDMQVKRKMTRTKLSTKKGGAVPLCIHLCISYGVTIWFWEGSRRFFFRNKLMFTSDILYIFFPFIIQSSICCISFCFVAWQDIYFIFAHQTCNVLDSKIFLQLGGDVTQFRHREVYWEGLIMFSK
jgi:hypothetical protein